jgi:hypothetical protein
MKLNALWADGDLRYIERLCLTSAVAVGHEVDLFTYGSIGNVPAGVSLRDAREVMPERLMLKYESHDSVALGADIFRLMLQQQGRGCYIDCDVLLLRPIPDEPYIFGWQSPDSINNAVLKLPSNCPIIPDILGMLDAKPLIVPWQPRLRRWKTRARALLSRGITAPEKAKWGTFGPRALTYFAGRHGLDHHAKPIDVFYPVPYAAAGNIFRPAEVATRHCTSNTLAVHLWNTVIRPYLELAPLPGSFIAQHCSRLGVADPRWINAGK